jgi:uncharacterized lipoprotein YmbA
MSWRAALLATLVGGCAHLSVPTPLYQLDPSVVHRIWHSKLNAFRVVTQFVPGRIPGADPP